MFHNKMKKTTVYKTIAEIKVQGLVIKVSKIRVRVEASSCKLLEGILNKKKSTLC
jgi:hypothetical protein